MALGLGCQKQRKLVACAGWERRAAAGMENKQTVLGS